MTPITSEGQAMNTTPAQDARDLLTNVLREALTQSRTQLHALTFKDDKITSALGAIQKALVALDDFSVTPATLPCGHPLSAMLTSAETGANLYCEHCDDKSARRDAEQRETELSAEQATPPGEPSDTEERAKFEAWITKDAGDLSTFGSGRNIHYRNSAVNNAWTGWWARAAIRTTKGGDRG